MKCPCGCKKVVANGHYWATEACGKKARKKGLYMPQGGDCRSYERMIKRFGKKGRNHELCLKNR